MDFFHEGGGVKACQNGLGYFFARLPGGCKGLPGWFGALFSTFARFAHIEPAHFKKGLPKSLVGIGGFCNSYL